MRQGSLAFERRAGTGFGLHLLICKHILKVHGGDITVDEDLDGELSIAIDLPSYQNDSGPSYLHYNGEAVSGLSRKQNSNKVFSRKGRGNSSAMPLMLDTRSEKINLQSSSRKKSSKSTRNGSKYMQREYSSLGYQSKSLKEKGSSYRLLIVDDSKLNRKIMTKLMTALGHQCDEAHDGAIFVEIAERELRLGRAYDAVLLDNEMPIMRGRDAVRQVREMGYKGVVIGVTGNVTDEDVDDFVEQGVDMVILKPLTVESFENAMATLRQEGVEEEADDDHFDQAPTLNAEDLR